MNGGIISARYAKALFMRTEELGTSKQNFQQIRSILNNPDCSIDESQLSEELLGFVSLVAKNSHLELLRTMLLSYTDICLNSWGMRLARITTAVEIPNLEEKLKPVLTQILGCELIFETYIDPDIIGGFVVEFDSNMLDASVRHQIESVRNQFVVQANRIV